MMKYGCNGLTIAAIAAIVYASNAKWVAPKARNDEDMGGNSGGEAISER